MRKMLTIPQIVQATGRGRTSIYTDARTGLLTPLVSVGPMRVALPDDEVEAIVNARIRGDSEADVRALVARLVERRKALPA